jgi:hypothetical protein
MQRQQWAPAKLHPPQGAPIRQGARPTFMTSVLHGQGQWRRVRSIVVSLFHSYRLLASASVVLD